MTSFDGGAAIEGASVTTDTGENTITAADGSYTLSNVPTGTRTVTASANGYVSQEATVSVTDGVTSSQDFVLDPAPTSDGLGSIKGTVTDSDTGAKLAGVSLMTDTGESATTNRGGKYTLKDVPAGLRSVTADKSGYVSLTDFTEVTAGQTSTLPFSLAPE